MDALLTADQVADLLGISKAYVYELAQTWKSRGDHLASVRIGRSVRFRQADVTAYIEAHTA